MPVTDLGRISLTYHNLQSRRIEANRRRIQALQNTISDGRVIPDPADLPIGRGRRLEATVLFLDISGFTARPSETAADQEAQVRVLSLFFSEIIRVVGNYGGTIEKNTGDGIMGYFSRSSGPGDVRHRGVACAMSIFYAVDQFINPSIERSGLEPIRFRICLDHGWITVARLGAAQRFNHIVAIGAVANRTSKMLAHARANELLLGDAMLDGLPSKWLRDHVEEKSSQTGWHHRNGQPYTFWLFDGRWNTPTR